MICFRIGYAALPRSSWEPRVHGIAPARPYRTSIYYIELNQRHNSTSFLFISPAHLIFPFLFNGLSFIAAIIQPCLIAPKTLLVSLTLAFFFTKVGKGG
jgi:hypothetical protein